MLYLGIRKEIDAIDKGISDPGNNLLSNAPHSQYVVTRSNWDRPYTREEAAFPMVSLVSLLYNICIMRDSCLYIASH